MFNFILLSCYILNKKKEGNNSNENNHEKINYRLPRDLLPYFYEIFIKPYFNVTQEPDLYIGNVLIKFRCTKTTSKLIVHSHENLEINNSSLELSSLSDSNFNTIKKFDWFFDQRTQFFIADFKRNIFFENQNYSLNIGFKGLLKDDNAGIYKSSYRDNEGNKRF